MNFSRELNNLCHSLALIQSRIFEKSVSDGLPSLFFIKSFMLSEQAREFDNLNLESADLDEVIVYEAIKTKIKCLRGELLPYDVIKFIGYFYRASAYLLDVSSRFLYENISPKFLIDNYLTLHSISIEDAIREVFTTLKIEIETKEQKFFKIYSKL